MYDKLVEHAAINNHFAADISTFSSVNAIRHSKVKLRYVQDILIANHQDDI